MSSAAPLPTARTGGAPWPASADDRAATTTKRDGRRKVGPQKAWEHALNERKAAGGSAMPDGVVTAPIAGEATIAGVEPTAPAGQEAQVLAWACSVAAHRIPGVGAASRR